MTLDIPTLFVAIVLVSATLTLMVAGVAERGRPDGLYLWATGLVAHTGAYSLFASQRVLDPVWSVVLANVLLSMVFALFGEALCQFLGRQPKRLLLWAPVAVVALGYLLLVDALVARQVFGRTVFSLQIASLLVLLFHSQGLKSGRGAGLLGLGLAALLPLLLAGAVAALDAAAVTRLVAAGPLQVLTFLVAISSTLLATFGFFLMNKERSDRLSRTLALFDELTGLPNRRQSLSILNQQVAAARRSGQALTVLMLDIDHFKRVNDQHGHLVGDAALRHVARALASRLRQQDTAGRFGGEEFLCVLPATSITGGVQLADAVRAGVAGLPFAFGSGRSLSLTLSVGVAALPPGGSSSAQDLISAADAALYRAKAAGRNAVAQACASDYRPPGAVPGN